MNEQRRGEPLRVRVTRANGQPAFGSYLSGAAYSLFVLTLEGSRISAITWFAGGERFAQFGLPATM